MDDDLPPHASFQGRLNSEISRMLSLSEQKIIAHDVFKKVEFLRESFDFFSVRPFKTNFCRELMTKRLEWWRKICMKLSFHTAIIYRGKVRFLKDYI